MTKLSETQKAVLARLTDKPQTAYRLQCKLSTLRALVKSGVARDVTPHGPGGMFSPETHFEFVRK